MRIPTPDEILEALRAASKAAGGRPVALVDLIDALPPDAGAISLRHLRTRLAQLRERGDARGPVDMARPEVERVGRGTGWIPA